MSTEYSFYYELKKGHYFKTAIELLSHTRQTWCPLFINEDEVTIRTTDPKNHILYNFSLKKNETSIFERKSFSFNLTQTKTTVKAIKKKDSVALLVKKDTPNKLGICITPIQTAKNSSSRKEIIWLTINDLDDELMDLPETAEVNGEIEPSYGPCTTISSSDFQKIKKMSKINSKILVTIGEEDYISFFAEGIYSMKLEVGEGECDGMYSSEFHMDLFDKIAKLHGLSTKLAIYSPVFHNYPLKIHLDIDDVGYFCVYMKDTQQIDFVE